LQKVISPATPVFCESTYTVHFIKHPGHGYHTTFAQEIKNVLVGVVPDEEIENLALGVGRDLKIED